MTIRERLKKMTQADAAALLGRSQGFISQLRTGNAPEGGKPKMPSIETVAEAAAALGLDDAEIGASVREFCPRPFLRVATTPQQDPTSSQAA